MSTSGRVLALDFGTKRIGIALSDPDRRIASPAGVLVRRSAKHDLAALRALVAEREVGCIVVGLPLHMSGHRGPEAARAEAFAVTLREATGLRVDLLDERWTTREAARVMHEAGRSAKQQRGIIDGVAAALLLDTWLSRERVARAVAPDA
jgi:putative Holliday junction resolvase